MSIAEEIEKLNALKNAGTITEEEFQEAKKKLLAQNKSSNANLSLDLNQNQWSMFIHFAPLLGPIGWVIAVVLWQIKKDESEYINQQGKNVTNWLITELICSVIIIPFCFIFVGFILGGILAIAGVVFAIMGGLKANEGIIWPYPATYNFIK